MLFWGINFQRMVESSGSLACAVVTVMHDLEYGYVDSHITFLGFEGLKFHLKGMQNEMNQIQQIPDVDTMKTFDYKNNISLVSQDLTNFQNGFIHSQCRSCAAGSDQEVTPQIVRSLGSFYQQVQVDLQNLTTTGKALNQMTEVVTKAGNATSVAKDTSKRIDFMLKDLDKVFDNLQIVKQKVLQNIQYQDLLKKAIFFLWVALVVFMVLAACNSIIVTITLHARKCLGLNSLAKMIMTLNCCFGGFISGISMTLIFISVVFVNGCYYYNQALKDRAYMKSLVDPGIYKFADNCFYNNSSGNFSYFFEGNDISGTNLDQVFAQFNQLSSASLVVENSLLISGLMNSTRSYNQKQLLPRLNYTELDQLGSNDAKDGFSANLARLNTAVRPIRPKDFFTILDSDCPTGAAQSSASTKDEKQGLGSNYCIILPSYNFASITPRYGNPTPDSQYKSLKTCLSSYHNLIQKMSNSLSQGPLARAKPIEVNMKAQWSRFKSMEGGLNSTIGLMKTLKSNVTKMFNCKVYKREADILMSAICGQHGFGINFSLQAYLLTFLGPLMSLLGGMIWCQTYLVQKDIDRRKLIARVNRLADIKVKKRLKQMHDEDRGLTREIEMSGLDL